MEQDGAGGTQRLFVAVPLPDGLLPLVQKAQEAVPPVPGLRLLKPDQWHVTLAFMGQVGPDKAATAREVISGLPADMGGDAVMGGFLMLPSSTRARVVTLALEDAGGVFARLFEAVMGGLEAGGVMAREKRPFRPHLTIARLRNPGTVRPRYESERASFAVQSVCLYQSELRREGALYTVVSCKTFGQGDVEMKA